VARTRDGHSVDEIAFLMQISPSLVRAYQELYERYNTPEYQERIEEIIATVQRGMSVDETPSIIQRPRYLVEEYVWMIEEFGLDEQKVYDRAGVQMTVQDDKIEPTMGEIACHNERREQEPIAGSPAPAFPSR
jgi:transposase